MIDKKSILGYRKDSPYKNDPFIDILTPNGSIDMSMTDKDLIGIDNLGNVQQMIAGNQNPYQFEGDTVREIPMKSGGLTSWKTKEMLRDGTAQGHKLTKKQKRYFGWVAGGKKQLGGFQIDSTLNANRNVPFVDRIINADKYPQAQVYGQPYPSTHLMMQWDNYAVPQLRYVDGKWINNTDPTAAINAGDAIKFKTEADALSFTQNYKKSNLSRIKQEGGEVDNPYKQDKMSQLFSYLFEEDTPPVAPSANPSVEEEELPSQINEGEEYDLAMQIANQPFARRNNPYIGSYGFSPEKVKDQANYSYNFFLNKGYTPAVAAGLVANIQHESNFDPNAVGDEGKARGLAQWHPDRYGSLSRKFNLGTLDGSLNAIDYELRNSEKDAYNMIKGATSPEQAALLVDRHFERSAGLSTGKRMNTAKNIFNTNNLWE